ncbi:bifunctional folylpolyglutamate synthase/dihydrofolate synthase, partial [Brotonthovivens ammoniilytica]
MRDKFQQAVEYLYQIPRFTTKNSLEHTKKFLKELSSPQEKFKIIHVAGTNGKGSVCMFLNSILLNAKKTVGMFTSPHLVDIRERFVINGRMCSKRDFLEAYETVQKTALYFEQKNFGHPTFFEFIFAMGMLLFCKADVEYVVLETGLGGRLDATNSISSPIMTVLTSVSLDHTEILGDTIEKIAAEKAGILKPGVPVVYDSTDSRASEVIKESACRLGCPAVPVDAGMCAIHEFKNKFIDFSLFTEYDSGTRWKIPFVSEYQAVNAALAITAVRLLEKEISVDTGQIKAGLMAAVWPGRMEEVLPEIYLDGAHNTAGIREFIKTVKFLCRQDTLPPLLLFSMVKEKDYHKAVRILAQEIRWADIAVTAVPNQRGIMAGQLQDVFKKDVGCRVTAAPDYRTAFDSVYKEKQKGQKL